MPYPPLGTLYAAGYLRAAGISVALYDTMLESTEESIRTTLFSDPPKLLAIYDDDFNYLNKMCLTRMREAAFVITGIAKEMNIPVIIHGSDAADHAEQYLAHGADAVVIGEGEQTLKELCESLLRGSRETWSSINGVVYNENGSIVRTAKRNVSQTLDALPFPAWDLIDWQRYRSVWMEHHGYFSVNMVTTRGCPYHCNWCAKPIYGQVYNTRSPENVAAELEFLKRTVRPDHIWFADDIFGLKPDWIHTFAHCVNEKNIKTPFKIQSRADLLIRDGEVAALADAGCMEVWIGAESGSQKVLDAMEKGITRAQIGEARNRLKQNGLQACFFLQFGYRGETMEDIRATIQMVEELIPENIGISVSYPLPGTKFYNSVISEMGSKKNWTDSDDLSMMYRGTFSPGFYKKLHRYVHRRFRLKQGIQYLKELFGREHPMTRTRLRRIMLLIYYIPAIIIDMIILKTLTMIEHG